MISAFRGVEAPPPRGGIESLVLLSFAISDFSLDFPESWKWLGSSGFRGK